MKNKKQEITLHWTASQVEGSASFRLDQIGLTIKEWKSFDQYQKEAWLQEALCIHVIVSPLLNGFEDIDQ